MRFVVVSGPARTGKMPLSIKLMSDDPRLVFVHRDTMRDALATPIDEWAVTLIMRDTAARLLALGHSVIICAWNLEPEDAALWRGLAAEHSVSLEWLDVREPAVAAMIPAMVEAA